MVRAHQKREKELTNLKFATVKRPLAVQGLAARKEKRIILRTREIPQQYFGKKVGKKDHGASIRERVVSPFREGRSSAGFQATKKV